MPQAHHAKYVWPSSSITEADMAILHAVRESSHVSITELIARAVRKTYGQERVLNLPTVSVNHQDERKAA